MKEDDIVPCESPAEYPPLPPYQPSADRPEEAGGSSSEKLQEEPKPRTKRQKAAHGRTLLFEDKKDRVRAYIKANWSPKYQRAVAMREEIIDLVPIDLSNEEANALLAEKCLDSVTECVTYLKRLGPHPGIDADAALTVLYGHPPTQAQIAHADAYLDRVHAPQTTQTAAYLQAKKEAVEYLCAENPEPFFLALARFGPQLLADVKINTFVQGWWFSILDPQESAEERETARRNWRRLLGVLSEVGSGATSTLSPEEEAELVALCNTWLPICQTLKKASKRLWETPAYQNSELSRREAREKLAERLSVEIADVEAILWSFEECPGKARERTPWQAMLRIVARKYILDSDPPRIRGEKTVENAYRKWLKAHPEHKTKKRKPDPLPVIQRPL